MNFPSFRLLKSERALNRTEEEEEEEAAEDEDFKPLK
jgi:hypothetical protein